MNNKTGAGMFARMAGIACALTLAANHAFGLGADYPNGQPASNPGWPAGMTNLVNLTNRFHGFFVNSEDIFFFSGSASNFEAFLADYAKIQGPVDKHRLILHEGTGEAKSPWEKTGRPCDWELYGCPRGWLDVAKMAVQGTNSVEEMHTASKATNYVLEVHFWTGGKIALDKIKVPPNVEIVKDKQADSKPKL